MFPMTAAVAVVTKNSDQVFANSEFLKINGKHFETAHATSLFLMHCDLSLSLPAIFRLFTFSNTFQ